VKENAVLSPVKFDGWKQVFFTAMVTGAAGSLHMNALTITNTAMMSGGKLVISGTMYGLAYSLFSLMQGPPQPFVAALTKRIGPRKTLIMGCLLSAVLCLGLSNIINSAIVFVLLYGVVFGLAIVLTIQLPAQTIINNWFYQLRGKAQSIMRSIAAIFQVIGPYLATSSITVLGKGNFKYGWYMCGLGSVIGLICCFFLKDSPEQHGQKPDGITAGAHINKTTKLSTVYKRPPGSNMSLKEARKTPVFWAITIGGSLAFMSWMILSFSSVHFANNDYSLEMISIATGAGALVSLAVTMLLAALLDRIEPAYIFALFLALFGVSCFFAANPAESWAVYFSCVMIAILNSLLFVILPTMLANYFGSESFPAIQGFSLLIGGLASSTTGVIGGIIRDASGGYSGAFLLYGALALISAAIFIFLVGIPCTQKYKKAVDLAA
jgi:MFS family permease